METYEYDILIRNGQVEKENNYQGIVWTSQSLQHLYEEGTKNLL